MISIIIDRMVKIITEKRKIFESFQDELDKDFFSDVNKTDGKLIINLLITFLFNIVNLLSLFIKFK